jgi:hypothetical protein
VKLRFTPPAVVDPPVIPEAERSEAIRDLVRQVETHLTRSRIGALLAFGSHPSVRDDGWKDLLAGMIRVRSLF